LYLPTLDNKLGENISIGRKEVFIQRYILILLGVMYSTEHAKAAYRRTLMKAGGAEMLRNYPFKECILVNVL